MARAISNAWAVLERRSATAFLVGGGMFLLSGAVTVFDIAVGAEQFRLQLGQATVGAGWIAGLVGLLGLYPELADWKRWAMRGGVAAIVLGLVGYVIMTAGVLAIYAGVPESTLEPLQPVFLPLMLIGSVLPFPLFGLAVLRSDRYRQGIGGLLIGQTLVFLANIVTPTPATVVLVVLVGLIIVNVGVGYMLRRERNPKHAEVTDSTGDATVG